MKSPISINADEAQRLCSLHAYEALGETLCDLAEEIPSLSVIVADYGRRLSLERLRKEHPEDYLQAGIAEQDQVSIAAALALEGFCTFVPSYASFITSRAFDQVRVLMGAMGAPIMLIGLSAGYDSGTLGATHISTEDISLMRSVSGVTVLSPSDNAELAAMLRWLATNPMPAYLRITGADEKNRLHTSGLPQGATGIDQLRPGTDVAIIATGQLCAAALDAADILADKGISASVTNIAVIEPLNTNALEKIVANATLVVTVEEHSTRGGLGSALTEFLVTRKTSTPFMALGTPRIPPAADTRPMLLHRIGLDAKGIATHILSRLNHEGS
jgi:transketolase